MRTYIFTDRERSVIMRFLEGKIGANDPAIKQIKSRIRRFSNLSRDVELYIRMRETISAGPA